MSVKKYIPNTITSLNLFCGVVATLFAFAGNLPMASILIIAGALFDFFDGFAARALGVSSPMGKELDSLADQISFGLAPAAIYSTYIRDTMGVANIGQLEGADLLMVVAPLVLAVFAGLRLAKFNIDTRQTENFLGLTTTATGLFTASLFSRYSGEHIAEIQSILSPVATLVLIAVFCALLVSEIPMFSLKIKHLTWKGNESRFILVAVAVVSIILFQMWGIAMTIALYVLFSVVLWLVSLTKS